MNGLVLGICYFGGLILLVGSIPLFLFVRYRTGETYLGTLSLLLSGALGFGLLIVAAIGLYIV